MGNNETQNVHFLEADSGYYTSISDSLPEARYTNQTPDVGLADFLKRPVRLTTINWLETDVIGNKIAINPWQLFISNTPIANKIANYAFLRSKLKIKVIINASPFYYGAMLVSYLPMPTFTPSTVAIDVASRYLVNYSQRPHQWLYPQDNVGFEIELPFLWHKDWLSLQVNQDFIDMGAMSFDIVNTLLSANGATGTGVTIQVYGWMSDIELSGPSVGLSLQSGTTNVPVKSKPKIDMKRAKAYGNTNVSYTAIQPDEYDGVISKPASALASAVGCLTSLPFIGYYARASQIGLSAVAGVASLFGFTNIPIIEDILPYQPRNMPALASSEISYPVEKLTLDPKNELSIDPGLTGDSSADNMIIANIIQRESFINSYSWASTDATNAIICGATVNPAIAVSDGATNEIVYASPVGYLSQMFLNWKGDIIYRLKIVCTKFHKGRLRLSYDPRGQSGTNIINTQDNTSSVFNQIIDIDESTNIEFRVPYQQAFPWSLVRNITAADEAIKGSSIIFKNIAGTDNGMWVLQVLTALSCPTSTGSIQIQVFVRAADNLEFANPGATGFISGQNYSLLAPQGGDTMLHTEDERMHIVVGNAPSECNPNRYNINYGEAIYSLRPLLRRYALSMIQSCSGGTQDIIFNRFTMSRLPRPYGYDAGGLNSAKGLISTLVNFPFNMQHLNPINWVQAMFIGYRGSTHVSVNCLGREPKSLRIYRNNTNYVTTTPSANWNMNGATNTNTTLARLMLLNSTDGFGAQALTNTLTQGSLNVHIPNMSRYKFQSTNLLNITTPTIVDDSGLDTFILEVDVNTTTTTNMAIEVLFAIGTDFSFTFFINVPTVYIYSALPTGN